MPFVLPLFIYLMPIFWFVRIVRGVLFYLYLWQLKEYRIGRFLDHFRTEKGRKLLWNKVTMVKLVLGITLALNFVYIFFWQPFVPTESFLLPFPPELPLFLFGAMSAVLAFAVYALEGAKMILDFKQGWVRIPTWTKKILFLSLSVGLFVILILGVVYAISLYLDALAFGEDFSHFSFLFAALILIDVATPLIVSAVVLGLQPFTILLRNRRLAKARAKRAQFKNLKVIGITGSYGKTSTKEFLAHILSAKFHVLKTPEHQNTEFGVANTILDKLTEEHEVFVCEMGAYKKGEIKALAEAAQPHIGVVTGVNEQHLATFGSMDNLMSAEGGRELIETLPNDGVVMINQKSNIKSQNYNAKIKIIFPEIPQATIQKDRVSFDIEGVRFCVPVYGGHNVQNLSLAIATARELGMSLREIAKAAESMPLELSALKVQKGLGGATIIDSTYSANPDGVIADLEYFNLYEGKKVIIMPCLIELGPAAKESHRRIGRKIAEVCDLALITTKEHGTDIREGAGDSEKVLYTENIQEVLEKVKGANAILLEGGKDSRLQRQLRLALQNRD